MPPQSFDPATATAVLKAAKFPRSGEPNDPELVSYAERTVASWMRRGQHDRLHARALADFLYKAAAKTYHCQAILRCLLKVLTALGNYTDAERALVTYLDLADKGRVRAQKGSAFVDIDNALTTVETAAEGLQMLVRYVRDAGKAKEMAEILRGWIVVASAAGDSQTNVAADKETSIQEAVGSNKSKVLSTSWTAVGSAYTLVARSALNNSARDADADSARLAFDMALTFDENSTETLYEYSLLLAEFYRDLDGAEDLVRKGREVDAGHLGLAHILALILSAKEKHSEAREVCRSVVQDTTGEQRKRMTLVEKRVVLQLRMTEIGLIEMTEGVQAALENVSDGLFAVYNELFTWDEDTVESQIHEASTSAISFPQPREKNLEKEKTRYDVVPAVSVPAIAVTDDNGQEGGEPIGDDDEDEFQRDVAPSPFSNPSSTSNSSGRKPLSNTEKQILDNIPQDLISNTSNIPTAILADMRISSQKSRSLLPKKSLILPRSIRRRLSDASIRSRMSSRQPITAASIIEKNKGGANRVLRNSLSVDDTQLKNISMQCLREVWLLVAGLFRRREKWNECAAAIAEATKLGGAKEDTFTERGFLMHAEDRIVDAMEAFEAALTVSIDYVPAIVGISTVLLSLPDKEQPMARDRAFVLLETTTKLEGWDFSEAWMLLGDIYESIGSEEQVRESWWRCVQLEETRPVRRWRVAWMWDTVP
ncbi:hypothetical protein POJ06DRAFT_279561 [Lipomyces tetrasporus]|uniref:Cargo-transport protein YPP1 n=1 Tax=Lipomyces tetrasporus TaxID=54092 RepID=A0AAD7QYR4_9ASCO|nr:uncharacterized protein POJ06DRAFT_279561 [Lipomyces tetrasporus]KAJ8103932.1 hypothetical protein POJ06DRAFT_279561 [Lipomyces tetrasporus]